MALFAAATSGVDRDRAKNEVGREAYGPKPYIPIALNPKP